MRPSSKAEFIQYCKQQMGLCNINVSDSQVDNRIHEALDMFNEFHRDATEVVFVATPITSEVVARGYLETPEGVHFVVRMLSYAANAKRTSTDAIWTVNGSSAFPFYAGGGLGPASGYGDDGATSLYIYLMDQKLAEYDAIYNPEDTVRFNRHTRRLYIETDISKMELGKYVVYEAYVTLESMNNTSIWNNDWLKRYAVALISKQWGLNLTKYVGGNLFGSDIQHNGPAILEAANEDIEALKQELYSTYTAALPMFVG